MRNWQALLKKVNVEHINAAIDEIRNGIRAIPPHRHAKKWLIETDGAHFPTKYILSRAVMIATGKNFPPAAKSGGQETLNALKKILKDHPEFKIVRRLHSQHPHHLRNRSELDFMEL